MMALAYYNNVKYKIWDYDVINWEELHRDNDEPALIYSCYEDLKEWFIHGKYHRENDKPARMWGNGACEWYKNGLCHRDGNKPAYIGKDGIGWFKNNNYYNNFKLQNLVFLQMFFKLLFHFKYNKIIWSPNDLGGKFTKYQLFLLFK
jgi:hypothetical protein